MSPQVSARKFDSYQQAGAWLRATFGAWADQLSEAEYEAVRYYASPAYQQLNLALRQQQPLDPTQQRHVVALDRVLRVPLPEPVAAYRGLELEQPVDFTTRTGRPLVFRGYVSTSLVRSVAEGFCALAATNHHAVLFQTVLPAGTLAGCPDLIQPTLEAELLLPRRQPFTLGEAQPPTPRRRYWTVKLHATERLLSEQPGTGAQHGVQQQPVTEGTGVRRTPGSPQPTCRATPPLHGPSIGR